MDHAFSTLLNLLSPSNRKWKTPGDLAQFCDPRILKTPALDVIDKALVNVYDKNDGRLIISCPPQIGKSQKVARWFPLWVLTMMPDTRIGIVSYEHNIARRWGRAVRDEIITHPELGLRIRQDLSAQNEWGLEGHEGGIVTAGIGGALTGRPLDLLIIDDPVKDRAQADSHVYQQNIWDWWTDVGSLRLGPGAPVIQVATRWSEKDLAGQMLSALDAKVWTVINIPAQADHNPSKGEVDILGRAPGEFMESTRRNKFGQPMTQKQWQAVKTRVGSQTWAALFQGHPSPLEGGLLKRTWWQYYENPLWVKMDDGTCRVTGFDEIIQSWDMAFKDTKTSDYVVGQIWARNDANFYLLDQVRGRWDFPETSRRVKGFSAKWPDAVLKIIEEKANGAAIIAQLRNTVGGMVPENPKESKEARVKAVSPLIESKNVYLPDPLIAPWVPEFVDECAAFPNGAHDDQVDPMSQALKRLGIMPFIDDEYVGEDDVNDYDYSGISPM